MFLRAGTRLLIIIALGFSCGTAGAAPDPSPSDDGVLPAEGYPDFTARLNQELGRALSEAGGRGVLGPAEVKARLAGVEGVAKGLQRTSELIEQTTRAALHMKRGAATRAARQAVIELEAIAGRFHARQLLARAHGKLAEALLFKPADEQGALEAFRAALAVDPGFSPDPDRTPPRTMALFKRAKEKAPASVSPASKMLIDLARRARVKRIVWIGARRVATDRVGLEIVVYDGEAGVVGSHLHEQVAAGEFVKGTAQLVVRALGGRKPVASSQPAAPETPAPASHPALATSQPARPPAVARVEATPWYKRWWVWTIVGAVVVTGVGVGLGLGLSKSGDTGQPAWDLEFNF